MPTQVTNYQCPSCTGPLHYSGASGKLECDYCGSSYTVAEIEALYKEKEAKAAEAFETADTAAQSGDDSSAWDTASMSSDWGADAAGMKTYSCPSCGAELICDANTAATACPYCGNPTVVPGQFAGALKPDYVLPFKLSREDAINALRRHYKNKPFLPRAFSAQNQIEKVQGVYVPFWMFDGEAEGHARYDATRSRVFRTGDWEVTKTDHFEICRDGSMPFEKVPVDASSRMPDAHMDSIEPYDYAELKPFSSAYLPGFLADKYDVPVADCESRADERCRKTVLDALGRTVSGYDTCSPRAQDVRLRRGKVHYALLPVWMLSTRWNGKSFLFAMNGQTGKMVGDLPTDAGKYWRTFAAIAAPVALLGTALSFLLR